MGVSGRAKSVVGALLLCAAAFAAWFVMRPSFAGDGELTDAGWLMLKGNRFRLDLGPVDLHQPVPRTYRFSGLPAQTFVVGLQFAATEAFQKQNEGHQCEGLVLSLQVLDENNRVVIDQSAPLNEWTWSSDGFVYRRGPYIETPAQGGGVTTSPVPEGVDGGNGTYFEPRSGGTYSLTFRATGSTQCLPPRLVAWSS